jgi:hypothetical protein
MESNQYDPVNKRVAPWMSMYKMNRIHGSSSCARLCNPRNVGPFLFLHFTNSY